MKPNEKFSFRHYLSQADITDFVKLTGDDHLLHTNPAYAKSYGYKTNIAHGMLVGAFFSTLVGKYLSSQDFFYLSQTLKFHHPVYPGCMLTVSGHFSHQSANEIFTLITEIRDKNKKILISGQALLKKISRI